MRWRVQWRGWWDWWDMVLACTLLQGGDVMGTGTVKLFLRRENLPRYRPTSIGGFVGVHWYPLDLVKDLFTPIYHPAEHDAATVELRSRGQRDTCPCCSFYGDCDVCTRTRFGGGGRWLPKE